MSAFEDLTGSPRTTIVAICVLVLFAALVPRLPLISAGLPFLYREDDTHHINRVLEMYKARTLDPQYFHKPSLHFYLRLPVVHASALWLKHRGELSSRREIRTRDPYGLAGYNFTASHPFLIETSRVLSIAWSLGTVILVTLVAFRLKLSPPMALLAGSVTAFSPEFLINSPIVGVDILMALFCTATTFVGILALPTPRRFHFILAGVLGGLATSSKYNALPICAVPVALWIIAGWRTHLYNILLSAAAFIVAFFAASPFILVSWTTFVSQLGYEIWHYQTGHIGHRAEPGFEQAAFYLSWLTHDGVGFSASVLAAIGLFASKRWGRSSLVYLAFSLLFAGLMVSQRTNFTRNMVPVIPFVALVCGIGGEWIRSNVRSPFTRRLFDIGLIVAVLAQPIMRSAELVTADLYTSESRIEFEKWIRTEKPPEDDLAIAGPILMPIAVFHLPGVDAFDPQKDEIESLVQRGASFIALPNWLLPTSSALRFIEAAVHFGDNAEKQRIVRNPALTVWKVRDELPWDWSSPSTPVLDLNLIKKSCRSSIEGHCWLQGRFVRLTVSERENRALNPTIELMSPWPNQKITISGDSGFATMVVITTANSWKAVSLPEDGSKNFVISISEVHSMASRGVSEDRRYLGVAVRE